MDCVLAIDQGTTGTRAMLFDRSGSVVARAQRELTRHYPADGWVEHDPEEIWAAALDLTREVMAATEHRVAALGITNQRETTILWERATGKPIHNAIVWQDRRTAGHCQRLIETGHEPLVTARTGLLLDHVPGARAAAGRGELVFGTIDCFGSLTIWEARAVARSRCYVGCSRSDSRTRGVITCQ